MSVFSFLDEIAELKKNEEVTAYFRLKGDEEFLKDHFEGFPVMPGVLQLEALKQASVRLLSESMNQPAWKYRLARVEDVRFGQFVRPGSQLRIHVRVSGRDGASVRCGGRIDLLKEKAPAGRSLSADLTIDCLNEIEGV